MKISAIKYYFTSFISLLIYTDFYKIPLILLNKPLLFRILSYRFYVWNFMDIWTLKEVLIDKHYEIPEVHIEEKEGIIIDIGLGIGDFSILMADKGLDILGFDVCPNRIKLAKRNIKLNKKFNVKIIKKKVTSLDLIFKQYKIKNCSLLKIDCEGCEYQIFNNTSPKILKKIKRIAMEAHMFNSKMEQRYYDLKNLLVKNRFKIKEKDNPVHNYLKFLYAWR